MTTVTLTLDAFLAGAPVDADAYLPLGIGGAGGRADGRTAHDFGQLCSCVVTHAPMPLELNLHHVWPLGMGGPDAAWNRVWLDPTAHANAHELLRVLMKSGGVLPAEYVRRSSPFIRGVVFTGYDRWVASAGLAIANRTAGLWNTDPRSIKLPTLEALRAP